MASSTIELTGINGIATTFTWQNSDGLKTTYIDTLSTLTEPHLLIVDHSVKAAGATGNDRHSVKVSRTKLDSNGKTQTTSVTLSWSVARGNAFSDTDAMQILSEGVAYLLASSAQATASYNNTRMAALIDGVTP